ncbi:MAG: serine protease [Planctomycetaceae bacterium]|nr:serine protease [Planctomycetaceae bacterium]
MLMTVISLGININESSLQAQSVILPAPRLLTMFPMGVQSGKTVEVKISGDYLEDIESLNFSSPKITATPVVDSQGNVVDKKFTVTIAAGCSPGVYEAWVMTRLGVSSCRVFSVGTLPEVTLDKPSITIETAKPLVIDTICNAVMTAQAINYYSFPAEKGQRIIIDCAAKGIDSKMQPVIILSDADGNDLLVERRGGVIDFHVTESASYIVKVHDLTYKGGSPYFYRLALQLTDEKASISRLPSIKQVNSFSWPPVGLTDDSVQAEIEPNNEIEQAQTITLPADITGQFYPAADVDVFHFNAKKGEVWWVEVASQRLGLKTDPSVFVQHVGTDKGQEVLTDVAELNDIASPIKVSSNGYSYDGPPYNAGSSDINGKIVIKQDGLHRLQITDLFGGTRSNPDNRYRLILRKAQPDFSVVGWALHMNLRNGDRNALSKPLALRGGSTMAIEVVVVRRDGFNGDISLSMEGLPAGVVATGVKIPAGKQRGILLVTAATDAPRGVSNAKLFGKADIEGKQVTRNCFLASMQWPVPNATSEIPSPRLVTAVPISVCGDELATLTIVPTDKNVFEARVGEKLTIPLTLISRCEHSGANITLSTFCAGFGKVPTFDLALKSKTGEVVLDLAALKTPAGVYQIAFYGKAVAKYRHNVKEVAKAEQELKQLQEQAAALELESKDLAKLAKMVTAEEKERVQSTAQNASEKHKQVIAKVKTAEKNLKTVTAVAKQKDIVDIVISTPCTIRVLSAEKP